MMSQKFLNVPTLTNIITILHFVCKTITIPCKYFYYDAKKRQSEERKKVPTWNSNILCDLLRKIISNFSASFCKMWSKSVIGSVN